MRILYITFEAPGKQSGGGIVCRQSLLSLKEMGTIDYVGPEFRDSSVQELLNRRLILFFNSQRSRRIGPLLKGITSGYYDSWKKVKDLISWKTYDLVYLESSIYHFVVKEAQKHDCRLMIRLHNVEQDYFYNLFKVQRSGMNYVRYLLAAYQEDRSLCDADHVLCLTAEDKHRIRGLYGGRLADKSIEVVPVAVSRIQETVAALDNSPETAGKQTVLMTGSLWYGPNEEGMVWFIEKVWHLIQNLPSTRHWAKEYRLLLAGARPSRRLTALAAADDSISLIDSPETMAPLFRSAFLYVAPIFSGAGMKVKVAEAFSFGLPVIGTSHAFIGYDVEEGNQGFIANEPHEFINAMALFHQKSQEERKAMRERILRHFLSGYEIQASQAAYRRIMNQALKGAVR